MPANPNAMTDEELLQHYRQEGDGGALGLLYKRYAHLVLGLCLDYLKHREDARDAVMDIFEKAARKLQDQEVKNFKSWLYYVSRNHCIDLLRRRIEATDREFSEALFVESNAEDRHFNEKKLELLSEALSALKPHQRECIVLFYLKGKSYEEVTESTSYSLKEVKSYLQNGRRNLKHLITKLAHERAEGQ